jgi:hypothetical protein
MVPQIKWITDNFKRTNDGYIVYKAIGRTNYAIPDYWNIHENSIISEHEINRNRSNICGCGVNFGTLEYVAAQYPNSEIWECLLTYDNLADLCVPYNTNGKARCRELKLLKKNET